MDRSLRVLSISVTLFLMLFAFQNCSDVNFGAANADGANKTLEGSDPDSGKDPDDPTGDDDNSEGTEGEDSEGADNEDCDDDKERGPKGGGDPVAECEALAEMNDRAFTPIEEGADIARSTGKKLYTAQTIGMVVQQFGSTAFIGQSEGASIQAIKDTAGNILICGMDVGFIGDFTRGNITIVGGDVGEIDNVRGNLRIIGGQILGEVKNSTGNIVVK